MTMLFKVIGPDGQTKLGTEFVQCIYSEDVLLSMSRCGYKFELNGKRATAKAVSDYVKENMCSCSEVEETSEEKEESANNDAVSVTQEEKKKPETSKKLGRIRCVDTGKVYNKQSEAARDLGIDPAAVSDSLKTGRKRAGYLFERVD